MKKMLLVFEDKEHKKLLNAYEVLAAVDDSVTSWEKFILEVVRQVSE